MWSDVHQFRKAMKNLIRSALSDPDEPKSMKVNRKRYAGDVGQGPRPRSGSEGFGDLDLEPDEQNKIEDMIDVVTDKIMEATSFITGKDSKEDKAREKKQKQGKSKTHKEAIKEEDEEGSEEEGSTKEEQDEEEDREAQMRAYEESLRQKRLKNVKKEELNSRYW